MNIIWKRPDGGVTVTPLPPEWTVKDAQDHAADLLQRPHYAGFSVVGYNIDVPLSREFRDAWAWTTPKPEIDIDMVKASELTKERLRRERQPLLEDLDAQFLQALETGADATAIIAEKQRLRDVTKLVAPTMTLAEMSAVKVTK